MRDNFLHELGLSLTRPYIEKREGVLCSEQAAKMLSGIRQSELDTPSTSSRKYVFFEQKKKTEKSSRSILA